MHTKRSQQKCEKWREEHLSAVWQKLHGSTGGTRRKVWTRTKILTRTYTILSRIKICRNLRTFWRSLGKKSAFLGQKQCFFGKKCTIAWYILHIIVGQICKFLIMRKSDAFVAKKQIRVRQKFVWPFLPSPKGC